MRKVVDRRISEGESLGAEQVAALRRALTHVQPLGASQQELISDTAAQCLLDDQVTPFLQSKADPYMIVLGRKGAGKTSMLADIRLKLQNGRRNYLTDDLPEEGAPFVIPVASWEHFLDIAVSVSLRTPGPTIDLDLVPVEFYMQAWYDRLWHEIIRYFYNFAHSSEAGKSLRAVASYMDADEPYVGPAKQAAQRLMDDARNSILRLLERRNSLLYFLFDSMEKYPVRNQSFTKTFSGLFPALNRINSESERVHVSFCIPEELETFLGDAWANYSKDFASSCRIRWRPIELLRITAHRFRFAMQIYDPAFYSEISGQNYSVREDLHRLFSRVLPKTIQNGRGNAEDSLAYILRHTQLLPRHVIATFNSILSNNFLATGGFRQVTEEAVKAGVSQVQKRIAHDVLYHYQHTYPRFVAVCKELLPELEPICSYTQLRKLERRMLNRIEDDIASVWEKLFQMGILGRVDRPNPDTKTTLDLERYCYGIFHFNSDSGSLGLATDGEYCFHPVFSRNFGIVRRGSDKRVVYPAKIEMVTLA